MWEQVGQSKSKGRKIKEFRKVPAVLPVHYLLKTRLKVAREEDASSRRRPASHPFAFVSTSSLTLQE